MKIAIAKNGDTVSEHFGHVEEFLVVHVENQKKWKERFMQHLKENMCLGLCLNGLQL